MNANYPRLYIIVQNGLPMTDSRDGFVLAWSEVEDAAKAAAPSGAIVSNWSALMTRFIAKMEPRPSFARVVYTANTRTVQYRVDLSASYDDFKALRDYHGIKQGRISEEVTGSTALLNP